MKNTTKVGRDSRTGLFMSVKAAQRRPSTTTVETIKRATKPIRKGEIEGLIKQNLRACRDEEERQAAVERLLRAVTVYDVLRHFGVKLQQTGSIREEQFSCPFHRDRKPSARVYPATAKRAASVWCFSCEEGWDTVGLWKKFKTCGR